MPETLLAQHAKVAGEVESSAAPPAEDAAVSDEALMTRYARAEGEAADQAFGCLYRRHSERIYRFLVRQCGEPAAVEELVQDIWLAVVRSRRRYRRRAKFTTFLYTIAHNQLVDFYRRNNRREAERFAEREPCALDAVPGPVSERPDALAAQRELAERLLAGLGELPAPQREAFLLHAEAGLSLERIAAVTGVGRETAKSRLRYAVARLRDGLRDLHESP